MDILRMRRASPRPGYLSGQRPGVALGLLILLLGLSVGGCAARPDLAHASGPYEGTALSGPASGFRLTDQTGSRVGLADFRGKVVVLAFLDSHCQDVCPLTSAQLRTAYRSLGTDAAPVVFLGVNVNVKANSAAEVMATTKKWQLEEIPAWHYLTGSTAELMPVWQAYNIAVVPQKQGEILHTPGVYLIDQTGQERWYISTPYGADGTPAGTPPLSTLLVEHIRELLKEK